ncbi:DinB family protein [Chitinophaga pendula]|uniref:DinB family protein n=1 Tax=Chitinophaga TaxID=79328 RepID=UPI000BAE9029|nr:MULTISPECIES: DinB family protein [Chitinophaga]ASZ11248.1 hypothetical protein CK934_09860 [Chitinophaga sp. MD30]UCJ05754.1 DinB family protein [Chitinophaga pendula]
MAIYQTEVLIARFNETIDQWAIALNDYTLEMLLQKPKIGSWSLGQVYVHITDDTKYFVERMKSALSGDVHSDKQMHEDAKGLFERNGFPDTMIEGPATDDSVRQPANKEELLTSLLFIKDEVNNLSMAFNRSGSKGKAEHPGLHYFTAVEWLQFAEMHMRHHFRQKKRIDDQLFSS